MAGRTMRKPPTNRQGSLFGAPSGLGSTSVLPECADVRFLDAVLIFPLAGGYAAWTATRPAGSEIGWALGGALVGTLAGVEGRGFLRYLGFAVAGASGTYLTLRLFSLAKPQA